VTAVEPPVTAAVLRDSGAVHRYVKRICFKTGPPHRVGAELEWLVAPHGDPAAPVSLERLQALLGTSGPPRGSTITWEPGGQLELSSPVAPDLTSCWNTLRQDTSHVQRLLAAEALDLIGSGIDPLRPPARQVRSPRYDAMEAYFDAADAAYGHLAGRAGRVMMASTAALQVNLDAGVDSADVAARWRLLHLLGPVMVAAFANSPVHEGRLTGWKSTRQLVWQRMDRARTAAVPSGGGDPVAAWADYALDAPVMALRRPGRWMAAPGWTFGQWVSGVTGADRPTEDDLAYHLTTLFPPVRPRGWLEVRYLDAQPAGLWPVPLAVLTALVNDAAAAGAAGEAAEPAAGRWAQAARVGLDDPVLARAATACFAAALAGLRRMGAAGELVALVEGFAQSHVAQGRCPADDAVAAFARGRTIPDETQKEPA
jgi:glutamate--cysteine ligase